MENIDELMRQQYHMDDPDGRFPFREEYWEQALALIEADEAKRKKRKRVLWWWFTAGLLLAGSLGAWWCLSGQQVADPAQAITGTARPDSGTAQTSTTARNQPANNSKTALSTGNSNSTTTTSNNQSPDSEISRINTKTTSPTPAAQTKPADSNFGRAQRGANAAAQSPTDPATHVSAQTPLTPNPTATSMEAESEALNPQQQLDWIAQLFLLPLPMKPVDFERIYPNPAPVKEQPRASASPTEPVKESKFRFGVSVGTAAHHRSPNDKWLGATAGLFAAWQFHPNWSANLGAQARYLPGDWSVDGANAIDSTLDFSYGFRKKVRRQRGVGVFMMEIPVSLQQETGPVSLELGVAPGIFLTSVYQVKTFEDASLENPRESAWLLEQGDNVPFNQYYLNAFAGVQYQLTSHLSVDLKGYYRFGRLSKEGATIRTVKPWGELGFEWRF